MSKKPALTEQRSNTLKLTLQNLALVEPLTDNQAKFFNSYKKSNLIILSGFPGTGKSFIALYKALEDVLDKDTPYERVILVRSAVPTRDLGALPGNADEKLAEYEKPYQKMCYDLFNKPNAYERLKEQKYIQFESTSYMRSVTYDGTIIILDEFQNCNQGEIETVITRVGEDSKIILCGDIEQNDLEHARERSGFSNIINIVKLMPNTKHIEFNNVEDICRSGLVKDFIIAKLRYKNG